MTAQWERSKIAELATFLVNVQTGAARDGDAVLAEITENATRALPGAQYGGITMVSKREGIRNVTATDPSVRLLDDTQRREKQGPCLAAAWQHHTIHVDDIATDERWPSYRSAVLELTSIRSIVSFRVFAGEPASGAMNFFADQPHAFDEDAIELGLIYATHTAVAWGMQRRDEQFRSALASRDVIGQAKGMLMERFDVDAVQAFDLLKRLSQDGNTPLHDIARRLTSSRRSAVED